MFIVTLTYKVPMETVERHLAPHVDWLQQAFDDGALVAAGRKVPRTGGVLLSVLTDQARLQSMLEQDPFHIHRVADYEVQEVAITRAAEGYGNLLP